MTIKLHHLKPAEGSKHKKKRVARGDRGRGGKTAGRGTKGTGARGTVPAHFEGGQVPLQQRQPKLGGFTAPNRIEYAIINVAKLEAAFEAGDEVTDAILAEKGLVKRKRPVKVLGHGDITTSLKVNVTKISGTAKDKIEAAGGTVS